MRVLLSGTCNLGSRCIPVLLAHKDVLTLHDRNPSKLHLLASPLVLEETAIVSGGATDSAGIQKAILDHNIETIVNIAGTLSPRGEETLLPKITKAVADAAFAVRKERGATI